MAKICKYCGAMNGEQAVACSRCHKPLQGGSGAGWHPYDPPHHELPPQPLHKKTSKSAIMVGLESGGLNQANTLYLIQMEYVLHRGELILLLGIGMKLMGQN